MNQEILDQLQKESLETVLDVHVTSIKEGNGEYTLRNEIVRTAGERFLPENDEVTVDMVIQTLAEDFPEIVFAIAEENYLKGFEEGLSYYDEEITPKKKQFVESIKAECSGPCSKNDE